MSLLKLLLLLLPCVTMTSLAYEVKIKDPGPIAMNSQQEIKCKIDLDFQETESWDVDTQVELVFKLTNDKSWALEVLNESLTFGYEDMLWSQWKSLHLHAHVIGVDVLNITSKINNGKSQFHQSLEVKVVLADRTLADIFMAIMYTMIIINTVNMGGQLDLKVVREVFRRPVGPAVGFASQFVIMPLVSR